MQEYKDAIVQFSQKSVLVVGDIMVDHYTYGSVSRVSPEAPVPVLLKTKEERVLGGAANVAFNLCTLGARVTMAGVVGDDHHKDTVSSLLKDAGIGTCLLVDRTRSTTVKHRLVGTANQQLLRLDHEHTHHLSSEQEEAFLSQIKKMLSSVDAVVLSDYAKGFFSRNFTQKIIVAAQKRGVLVTADIKPKNKEYFRGVALLTPNWKEATEMSGEHDVLQVGSALRDYFDSDILLTRGGDGIDVFSKGGHDHLPTKKIQVFDVTGAGDTVIATATLALLGGLPAKEAGVLANVAGGVVVQKTGTSFLNSEELLSALEAQHDIAGVDMVEKVWGYEKWLENNEKYCCKLLVLNKGYQCSLHYHKDKDEMFLVTKGHVRMELDGEVSHMRPGNFVRLSPGTVHRFTGMEDSEIIEVSTTHFEEDSYRLETSGKATL